MADIKRFVTPDNLGPDFEQDATAKEIKVNIDGVTLIRNAEGKLEAVGDGVGVAKEYVDDLTKVDGVTVIRNAEGELTAVGGGGDGADCCEPLTPQLEFSSSLYIEDGRLRGLHDAFRPLVIPAGRQVKLFPQTITGVVDGEDVEITINADRSWSCNLPVEWEGCAPLYVGLNFRGGGITTEGFLAWEYAVFLVFSTPGGGGPK